MMGGGECSATTPQGHRRRPPSPPHPDPAMPTVAENIATTIAGYATALAADSVSPAPSYTLDGKSVSRNEWRAGLQQIIDALSKTLNAQTPYVVSTKQVL